VRLHIERLRRFQPFAPNYHVSAQKPSNIHAIYQHFTAGETVRDIVIGMSDGLTVPFALAAGLTGAVNTSTIIITAGLAEIAAGSIAMGLGGFLAARGDVEHYCRKDHKFATSDA
jgi:hypothetical protein